MKQAMCSLSGAQNSELLEGGRQKKQPLGKTIAEKNFETTDHVDQTRGDIWSRGALRMYPKRISSDDRTYLGASYCGTHD